MNKLFGILIFFSVLVLFVLYIKAIVEIVARKDLAGKRWSKYWRLLDTGPWGLMKYFMENGRKSYANTVAVVTILLVVFIVLWIVFGEVDIRF